MPPKRKAKVVVGSKPNVNEEAPYLIVTKKARIASPDTNDPDYIFKWNVPDIVSLDDKGLETLPQMVKGIPWYVRARTETSDRTKHVKQLSLYLYCAESSENTVWYADAIADFIVMNNNILNSVNEKFSYRFRAGFVNSGYASIHPFNNIIDPLKGFIKNNSVKVEIRLKVLGVRGINPRPPLRDFTQPQPNLSDGTLTIDGKKVYISKQYLALHSPFFEALFFHGFRETNKADVVLKDVNYQEFIELLNVFYPSPQPLTAFSCPVVLKLADQFEIKSVLNYAERFLMKNKEIPLATIFKWADQYNLFDVQHECLGRLRKIEDVKNLQAQKDFVYLSDPLRLLIAERHAKLAEKEK